MRSVPETMDYFGQGAGGAVSQEPYRRIVFVEALGRGGFGAVYLADVHGRNDFVQRLAVKILNVDMAGSADIAARQRDEARLLARLNHDAIVKVFDLAEIHGRPAVLMEYVEGVDAGALLKQGPLPPRSVFQIVSATASALHVAWSAPSPLTGRSLRVVHRDIKPANLLLSRHGGVKVLDFGVARADFDREGQTESVQFGTARYMAPEQWLYGEVGHGVDVYALGVTTAELLAGAHLNRAPLQPERFHDHVEQALAVVVPDSWAPEVRKDAGALLRGMLCFDPGRRLNAAEVHEQALALADIAPGESLGRYARRVVPGLIEARRQRLKDDPLLSSASISAAMRAEDRGDALRPELPTATAHTPPEGGPTPLQPAPARPLPAVPVPLVPHETFVPEDDQEGDSLAMPVPVSPGETYLPEDADEELDEETPPPQPPAPISPDETQVPEDADAAPMVAAPPTRLSQLQGLSPSATIPDRDEDEPAASVSAMEKQLFIPKTAALGETFAGWVESDSQPAEPVSAPVASRRPSKAVRAPVRLLAGGIGAAAGLVAVLVLGMKLVDRPEPPIHSSTPTETPPSVENEPVAAPMDEPAQTAASPADTPVLSPAPARARSPERSASAAPQPAEKLPEDILAEPVAVARPYIAPAEEPELEPARPAAAQVQPAPPTTEEAPEQPPVRTLPVRLSSTPPGATVYVDGRMLGRTGPGASFLLTEEAHQFRLELGEARLERKITVSGQRSNAYHWDVSTGAFKNLQ